MMFTLTGDSRYEKVQNESEGSIKIYCRFADIIYSGLYLFDNLAGQGRPKTIIQRNEAMR